MGKLTTSSANAISKKILSLCNKSPSDNQIIIESDEVSRAITEIIKTVSQNWADNNNKYDSHGKMAMENLALLAARNYENEYNAIVSRVMLHAPKEILDSFQRVNSCYSKAISKMTQKESQNELSM